MRRILSLSLLVVLVGFALAPLAASQTPLDPMFLQVRSSAAIWAGALIVIVGIILGILTIAGVHLGPAVLLYIVFGFIGVALIGAASSGVLGAWVGAP